VLAHLVIDSNKTVPLKPFPAKPEEGFTFYIKSFLIARNEQLGTIEKRAKTYIVGQQVYRQNFEFSHKFLMFNVQFQPGALFKLLKIPMTEFLNRNVDGELLFGQDIRDVNDQLANTFCYESILGLSKHFYGKKFKK
jgi:hypothetical protein